MKLLLQRVEKAHVSVNHQIIGKIGYGLLIFLGVKKDDTPDETPWFVKKTLSLRIFPDENGKMNRSIKDIKGDVLIVSQFTLYGNCLEGNRPSFTDTASPEIAEKIYEKFIYEIKDQLQERESHVATGRFGASMQIFLINDGPVTFLLEK